MTDFFIMLHLIVAYNIDPCRCASEASFERVKLMVYIVRGIPVDLPSLIFWNIMKEADSFEVSGVPFGLLLTNFLDAAEVPSHVGEDRQKPPNPICLDTLRKSRSQLKQGKGVVDDAARPAGPPSFLNTSVGLRISLDRGSTSSRRH
ncbi:hypothetical protein CJ030_MR5G025388 [Morella rubra]|uniref:Uncharacterized protein n=1 Tax=Morella rubra TaxID=262757 RepID=A0A6A1VH06_9ROSI|nr:hypothetical protein CJ030_MR5G025388 [Morella rubra]